MTKAAPNMDPNIASALIGHLAYSELRILVEREPHHAIEILNKAEAIFKRAAHLIPDYVQRDYDENDIGSYWRYPNGGIDSIGFADNAHYAFTSEVQSDRSVIALTINPNGPVRLSDTRLYIDEESFPAAKIANIKANAIGTRLTDYIEIKDLNGLNISFNLDIMAPNGITEISRYDTKLDTVLSLIFDMVTYPYPEIARQIRERAQQVIDEGAKDEWSDLL